MLLDRDQLCSLWPTIDRPLKFMEKWGSPCGLLLESDQESAFGGVMSVAALLGGHVEKFEGRPVIKEDWNDRAGMYLNKKLPSSALFELRKERVCLVVIGLDRQPYWLQSAAKMPMDNPEKSMRSLMVLATVDDAQKVPAEVRSHFTLVRKTGRRRGPVEG